MSMNFAADFKDETFADAYLIIKIKKGDQAPKPTLTPPPAKRRCTQNQEQQEQEREQEQGRDQDQDQDQGQEQEQEQEQEELQEQDHFEQLAKFPVHRVVVCKCPYFSAQATSWSQNASNGSNCSHCSCITNSSAQPLLELTLDSSDQLPAAEAVVAALYGVTGALEQLTAQQQLDAVMLADQLQVPAALQQSTDLVLQAAKSQQGLPVAVLEKLAACTWPSSLLPLLPLLVKAGQEGSPDSDSDSDSDNGGTSGNSSSTAARDKCLTSILVAVLGNLNAVWDDKQLTELLLELPLAALQLLLASDQLMVDSEDVVYYTAWRYVKHCQRYGDQRAATSSLAPLVRCPQLTFTCLSRAALSHDDTLLACHKNQLQSLLSLMLLEPSSSTNAARAVTALPDAPASWQLGPRQGLRQCVDSVRVEWQLAVDKIVRLCKSSAASKRSMSTGGPLSAPIRGMAFQPTMNFCWEGSSTSGGNEGIKLGLFCRPYAACTGSAVAFDYTFKAQGGIHFGRCRARLNGCGWGRNDFFTLGRMAGGWDEAAWVAKGLPTSGTLRIVLTVDKVK